MIRSIPAPELVLPVTMGDARTGYATARDVQRRARSTRCAQNAATRTALQRLERLLSSGLPLRSDVPPGHYLDVQL
ncbi:MAG: hypothetical protein HWD60_07140 [Defluviicoccus sp.]|nr:MAG: hypothetical protein HWD60_07140 [Defluviicoccus sp.]